MRGNSALAAPPTQEVPKPISAAAASEVPLAAGAGHYMSFVAPEGSTGYSPFPGEAAKMHKLFGVGPLEAESLAAVGVDRRRPVVVSKGIVDPARLRELLASPHTPPPDAPFIIRTMIVVPVLDAARAQAALGNAVNEPSCERPRGNPARWSAWMAKLGDPADRRTAETSDAAYLCAHDDGAVVVRLNAARSELRWVLAKGGKGALTAAAAPLPLARELDDQLRAEGFYSARAAVFETPADGARLATATGLIKTIAGIAGVDASMRDRLWTQGVREIGATQRLVDSPPVMFSGFLSTDGVMSWWLTKDGRAFFSAPSVRSAKRAANLKKAIGKSLKPGGDFTQLQKVVDSVHDAGFSGALLIRHVLWPHILWFGATHPEAGRLASGTDFDDDETPVEIDVEAGRVRVRPSRSRW